MRLVEMDRRFRQLLKEYNDLHTEHSLSAEVHIVCAYTYVCVMCVDVWVSTGGLVCGCG